MGKQASTNPGPDLFGFYNTTNETGETLAQAKSATHDQNTRIMELMLRYKKAPPSTIAAHFGAKTPLTSIRRGMTDLTERGLLRKTTEKRQGIYGKMEHVWEVVKEVKPKEVISKCGYCYGEGMSTSWLKAGRIRCVPSGKKGRDVWKNEPLCRCNRCNKPDHLPLPDADQLRAMGQKPYEAPTT